MHKAGSKCIKFSTSTAIKTQPQTLFSIILFKVLPSFWKGELVFILQAIIAQTPHQLFFMCSCFLSTSHGCRHFEFGVFFPFSLSLSFYCPFWTSRNEGEPANLPMLHLQGIQEEKKQSKRQKGMGRTC